MSFAAAGVRGVCSTLGVSTASSSLAGFGVGFAFGFADFFLLEGSAAGVLGVESFSFVAVFGVLAGFIICQNDGRMLSVDYLTFSSPASLSRSFFRFFDFGFGSGKSSSISISSAAAA